MNWNHSRDSKQGTLLAHNVREIFGVWTAEGRTPLMGPQSEISR